MKTLLITLFLLLPTIVFADSFEKRVEIAKKIEKTDLYKKYEKPMFDSVGNYMANAMKSCFEKNKNADSRAFTFVVDIDKNGKPLNVDVKPKTNISNCFSSRMSKVVFAPPPKLKGRNNFPIYIDMKITP